jgi:hypothetical protein
MRDFSIDTKSAKSRMRLLSLLMKYGYKWHGEEHTTEDVQARYPQERFPIVNVKTDMELTGSYRDKDHDYQFPEDIEEILSELNGSMAITVQGVGEYSAVVTKKNVTVGCQTITWKKIEEIVEARTKLEC